MITNNEKSSLNMDQIVSGIKWNPDGLVPVITQDMETKEVLMLAYMNEEALRKTIMDRKACYYSRSRKSLWLKGETSGHVQEVMDIRLDCDGDAILLIVNQAGMACHENYFTCFHYELETESKADNDNPVTTKGGTTASWIITGEPEVKPSISLGKTLESLAEVIKNRNSERPEGSYTTYLFTKGIDKILKKVGEECAEVIIAVKNNSEDEIRYESADLLYHLLVLLEERGILLEEIAEELASRRK